MLNALHKKRKAGIAILLVKQLCHRTTAHATSSNRYFVLRRNLLELQSSRRNTTHIRAHHK